MTTTRFTQIAPGLFRGPRPTVDELRAFNPPLRTIVDLEPPKYEGPEAAVAKSLGINEVPVPMSSFTPPTRAQLERAASIIEDKVARPCLVHCKQGVDRTGAACAYWGVLYDGQMPDAAYRNMVAMGYHRIRYGLLGWTRAVKRLLAEAANRRLL